MIKETGGEKTRKKQEKAMKKTFGYQAGETEEAVLKFWNEKNVYQNAVRKNKGKHKFYFLDGPPYTSGKVHLGTAWNKVLKDCMLRYQRMKGKDVFDRACYDMHGLPIEHRVQEKHKLKTKEDIVQFGMEKFIKECEKFAVDNLHLMNEEFQRLGVWLDYKNSYMPITDESMEGILWLLQKVHEQGRLYEGKRSMTWCGHCATALAKHELEYTNVTDYSIFVKFKIKDKSANNKNIEKNRKNKREDEREEGREDEGKNKHLSGYLVIWTTTPWTIPFNLAVMAHPEIEYQKCEIDDADGKGNSEVWVVAKALANVFISAVANKKFKVLETFRGEQLKGLEYEHPFENNLPQYNTFRKEGKPIHTVVLSEEYVDTSAGTGLVHCAPGCGPQDYEVGHGEGLPIWNTISETGEFPEEMGKFAGWVARVDDKKFTKSIEETGALIATSPVEHEYPHCWRCHKAVVFRTTAQWFFKVEDLKEEMIKENNKVPWVPKSAFNAFDSWLKNLRDNSITKQRFWGTPLPVWRCEKCQAYEVVTTKSGIEKKWGKKLESLHKPWVDEPTWKCECGGAKKRIPDVMDVWIDPGCISWTALGYPKKEELFAALFPADFILEGKDQIRGWFNVLAVCSMLAMRKPSFKSVYMHGFVQDAQGRKMSKSLGNIVSPQEIIDEYGADTLRYYTIGGAAPAVDLQYNMEDVKSKHRNLTVLWNLHKFAIEYAQQLETPIGQMELNLIRKTLGIEERYMLSKLQSVIMKVTQLFEEMRLNEVPWAVEDLFLSLSRTYIQLIREKSVSGEELEKQAILYVLATTIKESLKLLAPLCPFISEQIYQNMKGTFGWKEESIHLLDWPIADEQQYNPSLEKQVETMQQVMAGILNGREKIKMGVRWPLKQVIVVTTHEGTITTLEGLGDLLKTQTNVKEIHITSSFPKVQQTMKADAGQLGADFGKKSAKIIAKLSTESTHSVLNHIEKEGFFRLRLSAEGEEFKIVKEHLIIERQVPYPYSESEFKYGQMYLNQERTEELEAEGYAREMMRRVQQGRKTAGLVKNDRIDLFVAVSPDLKEMLSKWEGQIKEKVGASSLLFVDHLPGGKHDYQQEEKVKQESFTVAFVKK